MADLLGADVELAEIHKLYECHERLLEHKRDLFTHLTGRWKDLFNARFEVLLYDLTSTYFESDPPFPEGDKRRYGYSRDKRPDCVQVVIALIVTPEGFPLAYEVLAGNTSDKTTLADFLKKIEEQYGKAERIWVMDRGIPTEKVLEQMRAADPPVQYLVGTPRGRLSQYEQKLAGVALAGGAGRRVGQIVGRRGGVIRAGRKQRPGEQGTGHAPASIKRTLGSA